MTVGQTTAARSGGPAVGGAVSRFQPGTPETQLDQTQKTFSFKRCRRHIQVNSKIQNSRKNSSGQQITRETNSNVLGRLEAKGPPADGRADTVGHRMEL